MSLAFPIALHIEDIVQDMNSLLLAGSVLPSQRFLPAPFKMSFEKNHHAVRTLSLALMPTPAIPLHMTARSVASCNFAKTSSQPLSGSSDRRLKWNENSVSG